MYAYRSLSLSIYIYIHIHIYIYIYTYIHVYDDMLQCNLSWRLDEPLVCPAQGQIHRSAPLAGWFQSSLLKDIS